MALRVVEAEAVVMLQRGRAAWEAERAEIIAAAGERHETGAQVRLAEIDRGLAWVDAELARLAETERTS
jgi:hypothetical protein